MDFKNFKNIDFNKISQSKIFKKIIICVAGLIVLLIVFMVGTTVGFRKAGFSYRWGENYYRSFSGPRPEFPMNMTGRDFLMGHGASGSIIKIASSTLMVQGRDNAEKVILIDKDTEIMRFREAISINDLKVNDNVVVIGSPNDNGQIEAKLIRVMPTPQDNPPPMP